MVAILGPNGAGKSTILRALAGLLPIERGRIAIDEIVVDEPATRTFLPPDRRPIGVVFQSYLLFANMSAIENVAFGLRAQRHAARPRPASGRRRGWTRSAWPTTPATGRVRCRAVRPSASRWPGPSPPTRGCCCSTSRSPPSMPGRAREVRRDLRRHLQSFDGMRVMVTHDPVDAYALADRVAVMDAGRIVQLGSIAEVTARPPSRYVASLIGTNLVAGDIADNVLTTRSGARVALADATPGPSFALIRPQAILLQREPALNTSTQNSWPARSPTSTGSATGPGSTSRARCR